jgi:hypothetical protein
MLLSELDAHGEIAGDAAAVYLGGWFRHPGGVTYFAIRPASHAYPLIVAPVPQPTGDRAAGLIEDGTYPNLGWQRAETPPDLGDRALIAHLTRICATFEDKPWIAGV